MVGTKIQHSPPREISTATAISALRLRPTQTKQRCPSGAVRSCVQELNRMRHVALALERRLDQAGSNALSTKPSFHQLDLGKQGERRKEGERDGKSWRERERVEEENGQMA
eukprot:scaffold890_cov269-Pinguiococcus_pyrenoidosus.AAC.14